MPVTNTSALVNVQEGAGAVVNIAAGATQTYTAGSVLTFALQSSTGVARWELKFKCPQFPTLDGRELVSGFNGVISALTVAMPTQYSSQANPINGIEMISVVSDGSQSIGTQIAFLVSRGATNIPFQHQVRGVILTALNAYTNVAGVLTENANGAFPNIDTSVVPAVGDLFLLPNGIAATAADAGVYQVTSLGAAGSKYVLTSAPEWPQGGVVAPKTEILVSEGTLMSNTTWVVTNSGQTSNLIGTNSITFYPRVVGQKITLVNGAATVNNVPILSNTATLISAVRNNSIGTTTATVMYAPNVPVTQGALGTATMIMVAQNSAAAVVATDNSTLVCTVFNQV
jgi:hypothetical protein